MNLFNQVQSNYIKFFSGKNSVKILKAGVLIILCTLFINTVQAQITAVQAGPWNDPATWDIGVPTSADDVIIGKFFTVTVSTNGQACKSLLVGDATGDGNLSFTGTSSLNVTGVIALGNIGTGSSGTIDLGISGTNAILSCNSIVENDPLGSGFYNTNFGSLIFTGSFTLPVNLFNMTNLTINGGIVVIPTSGFNLNISGDITIGSSSTFDLSDKTAARITAGGTLTIGSSATIKIGGTGTIPSNYLTHVVSNNSTVEFYGQSQSVVPLNSSQNYGNLIISSSSPTAITTVTNNINIAGNLTVNSGIFNLNTFTANRTSAGGILTVANGSTLRIAGSNSLPSSFNTHVIGTSSTIEYRGTSAQNVAALNSGQKYGNLSLLNQVKTLAGNVTVAGTLTFGGTPNKLVIGNNTLTLEGPFTGMSITRNLSCGSNSNLILNGAVNRTIFFDATTPGTTNVLNNFTINHNGNTTTLGNDVTLNNNLTFTAGKLAIAARTLTLKGNIVNTIPGGITGGTTSNIIFNSASVSPTLSMDQTTPGTTNVLSTLQINSGGQVVTMSNDLIMNSTTTFAAGKLAINGNTLTLQGNVTNTASEGIRSSSTSNLIINGAVSPTLSFDQTTPGSTNVINNLTVNSTGQTVSLSNPLRLLGVHTPTAGILASGGSYTIASTAAGTAYIAAGSTTGGYITGDVTVERYIPQNTNRAWRLLAAPTNGQTIKQSWQEGQAAGINGVNGYGTNITNNSASWSADGFDFQTASSSLLTYDQASNTLQGVTNTSAALNAASGYFMYIRGSRSITPSSSISAGAATILRTTGTLNLGNQAGISIPADKSALIGNPYACALDLRNIVLAGGCTGASFNVWDPKLLGSYNLGAFQTLTFDGTNFIVVPGGGSFGPSGSVNNYIESGAAFFTRAVASSGTVSINEASKGTGSRMVFKPAGTSSKETFITNLYAKNSNAFTMADGNMIVFDAANNDAVDGFDAIKRTNFGENLSILKNGTNLVIEKKSPITAADTFFFRMYHMKKIDYRLQLVANNLQQPNLAAFLEDTYLATSKAINLNDTTYHDFTIDANVGSSAEKRFRIVFKPITVLPVSITNLKATLQSKQIFVEWMVENQSNIRQYEVEKSVDGRVFVKAATTASTGLKGSTVAYNWVDANPATALNYYRIKSVDANGTFKYSGVVKTTIGKTNQTISIIPNVITGNTMNLQFTNQVKGKYSVRLLNNSGQLVFNSQQVHNGGNDLQSINLPFAIPAGSYQLEIVAPDNNRQIQKILIQRNN